MSLAAPTPPTQRLEVNGLRVETYSGAAVVEEICFAIKAGEVLGLVGESGSGKTTVALALLGYARPGVRIAGGSVRLGGEDVLELPAQKLRLFRGSEISYLPQDAGKALNPSIRIADQLREVMNVHLPDGASDERVAEALVRVSLPSDPVFQRRFIHQLSGGQQQRLALAIALACDPEVIVLDEPTTGLDVVTQDRVLREVARLCRETSVAGVFVSHNLAAVGKIATHIAVMYGGHIVEQGSCHQVLTAPLHPYTIGLISSVPLHTQPGQLQGIPGTAVGVEDRPPGCPFAPRCSLSTDECTVAVPTLDVVMPGRLVRCLHWQQTTGVERLSRSIVLAVDRTPLLEVRDLQAAYGSGRREMVAVDRVSFEIQPGECLALVGESGSGKSTIARCVAGLHAPLSGEIVFDGSPLASLARRRSRDSCRRIQIVFQNPYESLNPSETVAASVARPLQLFFKKSAGDARQEVAGLLERVRLAAHLADHYPSELSGGERQRVAVARALAAHPDLLLCDEVTSALDVSVQAAVLDLLGELQRDLDLAMLFITHDFGVVAGVADRVLVLEQGTVRERGMVDRVLGEPEDEYTRQLIAAIPELPVA